MHRQPEGAEQLRGPVHPPVAVLLRLFGRPDDDLLVHPERDHPRRVEGGLGTEALADHVEAAPLGRESGRAERVDLVARGGAEDGLGGDQVGAPVPTGGRRRHQLGVRAVRSPERVHGADELREGSEVAGLQQQAARHHGRHPQPGRGTVGAGGAADQALHTGDDLLEALGVQVGTVEPGVEENPVGNQLGAEGPVLLLDPTLRVLCCHPNPRVPAEPRRGRPPGGGQPNRDRGGGPGRRRHPCPLRDEKGAPARPQPGRGAAPVSPAGTARQLRPTPPAPRAGTGARRCARRAGVPAGCARPGCGR